MKAPLSFVLLAVILLTGCRSSERNVPETNTDNTSESISPEATVDSIKQKLSDSSSQEPTGTDELIAPDPVQDVSRVHVQVSEDVLNRYAGDYELLLDPSNMFKVNVSQGHLYFTGLQGIPVQFYAENDTAFFNDPNSTETLCFIKRGEYYNMILINSKGYVLEARRLP